MQSEDDEVFRDDDVVQCASPRSESVEQLFYELGNDIQLEMSQKCLSEAIPGTQSFCDMVYSKDTNFSKSLAEIALFPGAEQGESLTPISSTQGNLSNIGVTASQAVHKRERPEDTTHMRSLSPAERNLLHTGEQQKEISMEVLFTRLGIPVSVLDKYKSVQNLCQLHEWQTQCIAGSIGPQNSFECDLVYTTPTGGGKTLVAELLLLHTMFRQRKGLLLFVLPYVALAEEKVHALSSLLEEIPETDVIVECCAGKKSVRRIFHLRRTDRMLVVVCTIEKGNQIINEHSRRGIMSDIHLVVVDEVHLIEESARGHLLEMMLTKLVYSREMQEEGACDEAKAFLGQLILMSASKLHARSVFEWIEALNTNKGRHTHFFETNFRPIPLESFLVKNGDVFTPHGEKTRSLPLLRFEDDSKAMNTDLFDYAAESEQSNLNQRTLHGSAMHDLSLLALVNETLRDGNQVLVFCATKRLCETTSVMIGEHTRTIREDASGISPPEMLLLFIQRNYQVQARLETFDRTLVKALGARTAFHHAGLSHEERSGVEYLFREGVIRVLCCTTTLASGVNLPVRRVIFRSPLRVGNDIPLNSVGYNQASGRAGRAGLDTKGESYMLVQHAWERPVAEELLRSVHEAETHNVVRSPVLSSCRPDRVGLNSALLEAVDIGMIRSVDDIQRYLGCTLLSHTEGYSAAHYCAQAVLRRLEGSGILRWSRNAKEFNSSLLGKACVASLLAPLQGLSLHAELSAAQHAFVLSDDLHLLFYVVPNATGENVTSAKESVRSRPHIWASVDHEIYSLQPDWVHFYANFYLRLSKDGLKAAGAIGVDEGFLINAQNCGMHSQISKRISSESNPSSAENNAAIEKLAYAKEAHRRFYVALILQEIINEVPHEEIGKRFALKRAQIQKLMESASTLCARVGTFCRTLDWWVLACAYEHLAMRLSGGVHSDLIELMQIPSMTARKARALHRKGIESVEGLALASVTEVCSALESVISLPGSRLNQKKVVQKLVEEAQLVLQSELGDICEKGRISQSENTRENSPESSKAGVKVPETSEVFSARESTKTGGYSVEPRKKKVKTSSTASSATGNAEKQNVSQPVSVQECIVQTEISPDNVSPLENHSKRVVSYIRAPLDEVLQAAKANKLVAFSLYPLDASVGSTPTLSQDSACGRPLQVCVLTDDHRAYVSVCASRTHLDVFLTWLEDANCQKVCSNWKAQLRTLISVTAGWSDTPIRLQGFPSVFPMNVFDPTVHFRARFPDSHSLRPDEKSFLKSVQHTVFEAKQCIFQPEKTEDNRSPRISKAMGQLMIALTQSVLFNGRRASLSARKHFEKVESHLSSTLAVMEYRGIGLHTDRLLELQRRVSSSLHSIQSTCYALASAQGVTKKWNIDRPSHCAWVLYDVFKFPSYSDNTEEKGGSLLKKSRKKQPSSRTEILEKIIAENPSTALFPRLVMQYRRLHALNKSFILPLVRHPGRSGERMHGEFIQNGTTTGRVTMVEPNLQMIPHAFAVDVPPADAPYRADLRGCFVASPGHTLLSFDYMHMELRILATMSRDSRLCHDLRKESPDFFRSLAENFFDLPAEQVSTESRRQAKTICYGIIYGRGKRSIAGELGWSLERVEGFLSKFAEKYPDAIAYTKAIAEKCRRDGSVEMLSGRSREVPQINSKHTATRRAAKRSAVNSVFQGSAADIMKLAMVNVHAFLRQWARKGKLTHSGRKAAWIVLQIHDELLLEVPERDAGKISAAVKKIMEKCASFFGIQIPVRVTQGESWASVRT